MMRLDRERSLQLTPRQASGLTCHVGVLWLTREGDLCDVFLAAGDRTAVGRGLTIVTALEDSLVSLMPARPWWSAALAAVVARWRGRPRLAIHRL